VCNEPSKEPSVDMTLLWSEALKKGELKASKLAKKFKKVLEASDFSEVVLKGNNKYFTSREARTKRNSCYRGVSSYGNSWQVMLMGRN
jgi:hypothetical protein